MKWCGRRRMGTRLDTIFHGGAKSLRHALLSHYIALTLSLTRSSDNHQTSSQFSRSRDGHNTPGLYGRTRKHNLFLIALGQRHQATTTTTTTTTNHRRRYFLDPMANTQNVSDYMFVCICGLSVTRNNRLFYFIQSYKMYRKP